MIFVDRLIVRGNLVFNNCKIYNRQEQEQMGLPNVFEDDQLYFEDSHGYSNLTQDYSITIAEFYNNRIPQKALKNNMVIKVMRICMSYDITHSPAWVILPEYYEELGVPMIFGEISQFSFFGVDKVLHVTCDANVPLIQYEKS
jgi:hypothetical protein